MLRQVNPGFLWTEYAFMRFWIHSCYLIIRKSPSPSCDQFISMKNNISVSKF